MKTTCPSCKRTYDIRNQAVLNGAGAIIARRRRKAGHQITSDQARALQARGVEVRRENRDAQAATE